MRWLLGLLLVTTGCDYLFQLDHISGAGAVGDGGPGDGGDAMEVQIPDFCTAPVIYDPFDDPGAICSWGVVDAPTVTVHDGIMQMDVPGTMLALTGCTAYAGLPLTAAGVYLHVTKTLAVENGYTKLGIREMFNTTPTLDAAIVAVGSNVNFVLNGTQPYGGNAQYSWWRLRQSPPGTLSAEASNDGVEWTVLVARTVPIPAAIAVDIGAGVGVVPSSSGTAMFASFGVCN